MPVDVVFVVLREACPGEVHQGQWASAQLSGES